uniref:Uncharacterized protein n=1 Tax=Anguilla anguilla TaxID=7936 RepID=A0A0E9TE20_ANGAN
MNETQPELPVEVSSVCLKLNMVLLSCAIYIIMYAIPYKGLEIFLLMKHFYSAMNAVQCDLF